MVIVYISRTEISADLLSWVNMNLTISLKIKVVLCWDDLQVVSFLTGVASSSVASLGGSAIIGAPSEEPLPVLKNAFLQLVHLLHGNDVTRLALRKRSVAEFLSCTEDDLENLPGFGEKKRRRFLSFLHTPFPTSVMSTKTLDPKPVAETSASEAQKTMREALQRFNDEEEEDL